MNRWNRTGRALAALLIMVMALLCAGIAVAQVENARCSGSVTQLRLYDKSISAGQDARFKLSINKSGTVVATLTNEATEKETVILNQKYSYAQSIMLTVPGKLIQDGTQYTLNVSLVRSGNEIGSAETKIIMPATVAQVNNLSVSESMNPSGARLLNVSFRLPNAAKVTAYVRNASGVKVGTLLTGAAYGAGSYSVKWNGILSSGQVAPCGQYTLEIYCWNEAGTSTVRKAAFRVDGQSSTAIAGKREGCLNTMVLSRQPRAGESTTLVLHSEKSGVYTVYVKNKDTGKSWTYNANTKGGTLRLNLPAECFRAGDTYLIQTQIKSGSNVIGRGEMTVQAYIGKPSVKSVAVPASLKAGYGASMPVTYTLGERSKVTLYIRGEDGKVITTFLSGEEKEAGTYVSYWNGLNAKGELLPGGQYRITVACSNAQGVASAVSSYFEYEGRVDGLGTPYATGAIKHFSNASDPRQAERTPAELLIKTTRAGTLKIVLTQKDTGTQKLVYNAYLSAGTSTVSIPAKYLRSDTYELKAQLYSGQNVVGEGVVYLQPQRLTPSVSGFECADSFDTTWTPAIRGSYETVSSGYQHVIIKNAAGKIVRSIGGGCYSTAGHQTFSWDGRDNSGEYVPDGKYTVYINYSDDYGKYSNTVSRSVQVDLQNYPAGVYGYAVVGKGTHKTEIPLYNKPNGTVKTVTYGISASFSVLEDRGEWLYVEASCSFGAPQKGYVRADMLQKVAITSPYRIEICISRSGPKAQKMWVYKNDKLIDRFDISSGTVEGSTPSGTFILLNRKPYFKVANGICYDTLRICGGSCIHRVPMLNGSYASTSSKLGKVASHGCVRVPVDKSSWLYDNIPDTTPIVVFYAN